LPAFLVGVTLMVALSVSIFLARKIRQKDSFTLSAAEGQSLTQIGFRFKVYEIQFFILPLNF
jgi:hypothetical protein